MDHEDEFLNTFFTQISQLCFEKAKESLEKERERKTDNGERKVSQMGPWGMLLTHLPQVAVAERSYADLGFLHTKNKGFLRKDKNEPIKKMSNEKSKFIHSFGLNLATREQSLTSVFASTNLGTPRKFKKNSLKTIYEALKADLRRLEEMTQGTDSIGATVAEVSSQLCQFITARIQLIEFYEKMYNMSINNKIMRHQELLQTIEAVVDAHSLSCSHLALTAIKAALTLECEILVQLIKAQVEVQNWRFLPTLMSLYGAQARMSAWERTLQSKESWKRGFGATFLKTNQQPALYQWLVKLRSAILDKCSLYFHTTLSQQAGPGEMRNVMSKQNVDYYHKIQSFQRKWDLLAILFVFDARGAENFGPGYRHPEREADIKEISQFAKSESLVIVTGCPSIFLQKPTFHWDNIQNGIKERHAELLNMEKIVQVKSVKDASTYAMYNIDPRITLVTAFESAKQKDKETPIANFMSELCAQLRCNKVYEGLKLSK